MAWWSRKSSIPDDALYGLSPSISFAGSISVFFDKILGLVDLWLRGLAMDHGDLADSLKRVGG